MGTVIATLYSRYGYPVRITDVAPQSLKTFRERAKPIAASVAGESADVDAILNGVEARPKLEEAVQGSFFVHEAINENLKAKQDLFSKLDQVCAPAVVLGTNTSSLKLSEIFQGVRHRERVLGVHYITPAHIVKVVELIAADFTPPALVEWGRNFLKTIDRVGVASTDTPGFLVNRIQYALLSEVYRILAEGVATRDDVDQMIKLSLGPRLALWGPLLTEDLVVSKKTSAAVWDYLQNKTGDEKFQRPPAVTKFVEAGKLGAISGEGWYRFSTDYPSVITARDSQLKLLLESLAKNDRIREFKIS
jgi:3-hydroxybutyryl-CoA dehydrogenase